jgi:hypothetical protein
MNKVCVVSAYVPLPVLHLNRDRYRVLGQSMLAAVPAPHETRVFEDYPLEACWAYKYKDLPPADPRLYPERFSDPQHFTLANVVQHQRTTWAMAAAATSDADVFVWIDYGILKQGNFTGKPVTTAAVTAFIERLAASAPLDNIPFPGIWGPPPMEINPSGDNFRFCGSLHIWPRKYMERIHYTYLEEVVKFVERYGTVPLDLPIWTGVEMRNSDLPFRWYGAEYDVTQFDNYKTTTPLCNLAWKYGTDKCTPHQYTRVYDQLLGSRRDSVRNVFEIGIAINRDIPNNVPGASLHMWADYFPHAMVWGCDIRPDTFVNDGRIRSIYCDQSVPQSLWHAMDQTGDKEFDLIVDDGSHIPEHQITSMLVLLPFLRPDGLYIIEDVACDHNDIVKHIPAGYKFQMFMSEAGRGEKLLVIERTS